MPVTRSVSKHEKKTQKENEINNSDDNDESLVENQEESNVDEKYEYEELTRRSPYRSVRSRLNDLKEDNNEVTDQLYRRARLIRRSTSRSTSRGSSRRTKSPPKISIQSEQKSKRQKSKEPSTCWFQKLIWIFLMLLSSVVLSSFILSRWSNFQKKEFSYRDVIEEFRSDLPGISGKVIEAAIDKNLNRKKNGNEFKSPVVLMLYGNVTKIREFYLKLADTLIERNSTEPAIKVTQTVFDFRQLHAKHEIVIHNLTKRKMVLLDGLQNLPSNDYLQLYGFVDDTDSHVLDCLIVLSLNGDTENLNSALNGTHPMDQIKLIEKHVRKQLRQIWSSIDVNNLEAFLNRIVSFVAFVL